MPDNDGPVIYYPLQGGAALAKAVTSIIKGNQMEPFQGEKKRRGEVRGHVLRVSMQVQYYACYASGPVEKAQ